VRRLVLFALASIPAAMLCVVGLNGDLTQAEALVPMYLLGLIASLTVLGMCCCAWMVRAARWLVSAGR